MKKTKIGAYFYPLTTTCQERRRRARSIGRSAVDETLLTQLAQPLFDTHQQPNTYCLDQTTTIWDDSDEESMRKQVKLAREYGISFFIFNTYIGMKDDQPKKEMEGPIEVFKKLPESQGFKYARMAVNVSPRVTLPIPRQQDFNELNRYYDLERNTARFIVDSVVEDWKNPNYLRIKGRPYLVLFYEADEIHPSQKSTKKTRLREFVDELRKYSITKYKINPYIAGSLMEASPAEMVLKAGVDALTGYNFLPDFSSNAESIQDYKERLRKTESRWTEIRKIAEKYNTSFTPPVSVGWDASPRGEAGYCLDEVRGTCGDLRME
jgi:hypothetical protein